VLKKKSRPLDTLAVFETASSGLSSTVAPVRYAVRQVLDQEYQKDIIRIRNEARQARYKASNPLDSDPIVADRTNHVETEAKKMRTTGTKRDFFGRVVNEATPCHRTDDEEQSRKKRKSTGGDDKENRVWVSFHEGFSNAVRKPITFDELMAGF
jgi:chromosome transmission fidelity protein 18